MTFIVIISLDCISLCQIQSHVTIICTVYQKSTDRDVLKGKGLGRQDWDRSGTHQ